MDLDQKHCVEAQKDANTARFSSSANVNGADKS